MKYRKFPAYMVVVITLLCLLGCAAGPGLADYSYDLACDYTLVRSSGHQISICHKGSNLAGVHIEAKVVEVAWNDRYIVAKRLGLVNENDHNRYQVPDEDDVSYWIIDAHTDTLYGGYNLGEFKAKQKELNI